MAINLTPNLTMDQIDDWFSLNKEVKLQTIPKSKTGGRAVDPETGRPIQMKQSFIPPYKRHARVNNPSQMAYAEHYKRLEDEAMTRASSVMGDEMSEVSSVSGLMEKLEVDSTITGITTQTELPEGLTEEDAVKSYSKFNSSHQYDDKLSITKYRKEILNVIENNQVTVIQGPTGSGKTTQVPQYILDHYMEQGKYCNIVVTQPRRIAAIAIATRVCHERAWPIGSICGYQVALNKDVSEDTRLLFCTTGLLQQRLIGTKHMRAFTHVILDEVHERDCDSDFLLLIVRKMLRTTSRDVKVILMSATIDTPTFANYFSLPVLGQLEPAPVIEVQGRMYDVNEFYVEDLERVFGEYVDLDVNKPSISIGAYKLIVKLVQQFDTLEAQEAGTHGPGGPRKKGSVLIFLPGMGEISEMETYLRDITEECRLWTLPLHSQITQEEQRRVFDKAEMGKRKVILATNIAESSITVTDIKYVIDLCLTKNLICDPDTNYPSLQVQWASHSNCEQRKGRAGRVSNGRVYRMVTHKFYSELRDYGIPEMQRCPISNLVLKAKILNLEKPKELIGLAISPPQLDDIEKTILLLKEVGALASVSTGEVDPHDGDLTFLGRVLASLPVDIRIGKLLLYGHVFGVLEECLIIAASLSLNTFFSRPFKAFLESYRHKFAWAKSSHSDCIAILNAYQTWQFKKQTGAFMNRAQELGWARQNFIQLKRIQEVELLIKELSHRLFNFNIKIPPKPYTQRHRQQTEQQLDDTQLIIKLVMCGAFYPNYFTNTPMDEKEGNRLLSGFNPYSTVMVKGLPANQGPLYKDKIQEIFAKCDPSHLPKVHFEETRAYIEFVRDPTNRVGPNEVLPAVYLALKMKQLKLPMSMTALSRDTAEKRMREMADLESVKDRAASQQLRSNTIRSEIGSGDTRNQGPKQVALPGPEQSIIPLSISEIIDCGHFWAYYRDQETCLRLLSIQETINKFSGRNLQPLAPVHARQGSICLAPYTDESGHTEFYRARVEKVIERSSTHREVQVFYVDYGNTCTLPLHMLKVIDRQLLDYDFQAFECHLAGIKPSAVKCPNGKWTSEAKTRFTNMVYGKDTLIAKIFSVVNGVMRIDLYDQLPNGQSLHINKKLVDMFYADHTQESLVSKQSNQCREESILSPPKKLASDINFDELDRTDVKPFNLSGVSDLDLTEIKPERKKTDQLFFPHLQSLGTLGSVYGGDRILLNGPWSPLVTDFLCLTSVGRIRQTRIERDSVNSISLNDAPHDMTTQLMVASYVGLSPSGHIMVVRDTTILPRLPGLPAIVALLFTPRAELRTDRHRTKYTGALCGLGWDSETGGPALPDHDMEITFDTTFTVEDLKMINSVRIAINLAIGGDVTMADWAPEAVTNIQMKARSRLLQLVKRRRDAVEPEDFCRPCRWHQVHPDHLLHPQVDSAAEVLLNLHCGIALVEQEEELLYQEDPEVARRQELENKRAHKEWLHKKATRSTVREEITCILCNVTVNTPKQLTLHLCSRAHRQQEIALL